MACVADLIRQAPYDYDAIHIFYNEFINSISQKVRTLAGMKQADFFANFNRLTVHEVSEPDTEYSRHYYYELYVASCFYFAMLQNAACEQTSRMNAMENASKNAGEILKDLNLEYNKSRQARITNELCEIISGASAL